MAWLVSCCIAQMKELYAIWDVKCVVKNDKAKKELGIKFTPAKESLAEMGYSFIQHGFVEDKTGGKKK